METSDDTREPAEEDALPALQLHASDVQLEASETGTRAEIRYGARNPLLRGSGAGVLCNLSFDVMPEARQDLLVSR